MPASRPLSPLVERIRLEGLVERQRKAVTRLAEKLQDAEAVRQILEAELGRVRALAAPLSYEWPKKDSRADSPGAAPEPGGLGAKRQGQDAPDSVHAQAVPGLAPGGVPTTSDSPAPDVGGDASAETACLGGSTRRDVTGGERAATFPSRSGEATELEQEPGVDDPARGQPLPAADEPEGTHNEPRTSAAAVLSGTAGTSKRPRGAHMGKPAIDETGKRYGKLSVIERAPSIAKGARWRCGCDCGAEVLVEGWKLRDGSVTSCPTCKGGPLCSACGKPGHNARSCGEERPRVAGSIGRAHPDFKDETGKRFGRLTVTSRASNAGNGNARWHCLCDCGKERIVEGIRLRCGGVSACEDCSPGKGHGRGRLYTCSQCGSRGHNSLTCPQRGSSSSPASPPRPKKFTCFLCAGLPHRVEGKRCRGCGLEAAPETAVHATDFGSGESPLGRASA